MDLLYYAGLAFLGGLILNVMPCVLPVLTLKVFHLLDHSENDAATNRMHGLAYAAGVVLTFLVLAGLVIGLRAAGHSTFQGQQFQNTTFLAVMVTTLVVFALNCFGVFEITVSIGGDGGREGYGGSFVNGLLATVLSTPCSAPFLGPAVAYALLQAGPAQTITIFGMVGVGLAFPFVLVTHIPSLAKRLPRPGPWMETFKQLLGFTLLGTGLWLLGILMGKLPTKAGANFLYFLLSVGLALWAVGRYGNLMHSVARRIGTRAGGLVGVVTVGFWLLDLSPKSAAEAPPAPSLASQADHPIIKDGRINWVAYDDDRIASERERKRPVFADFTADWCVSCKANEKAVIETSGTRDLLVATNILPMKADMTDEDPVLEKEMQRLGRSGIPIYVIYYPDGTHHLLPEIITTDLLHGALKQASEKFPPEKYTAPAG